MQNGCSNLSVSALPISQMAADVEVVIRDSSDVFQHVQQSDEFASAIEQIISRFYLTANATADSCAESDLAQLRTDVRQYSGLMSDAATGLLALETTALLRQK